MTVAKKRGFTIVELLVVITIIGILMALLFPAINAVRVIARRTQCLSRERQIAQAIINYTTEHGDRFPARLKARPENVTQAWCWVPFILPYTDSASVFDYMSRGTDTGNYAVRIDTFICPADPPPSVSSAAINYVVNAGVPDGSGYDEETNGIFFKHFSINQTEKPKWVKQSLTYVTQHDGTSQTLMLSENVNALVWGPSGSETAEWEHCILWERKDSVDGLVAGTCSWPGMIDLSQPAVALNGPIESFSPLAVFSRIEAKARPSSRHPGGFVVAWCSGSTKFINQSIGNYIYAQIMTPNGIEIGQPPLSAGSLDL